MPSVHPEANPAMGLHAQVAARTVAQSVAESVAPPVAESVAQSVAQSVEGVVMDSEDGRPLEEVLVRLLTEDRVVVVSAVSDGSGAFSLPAREAGRYLVEAYRIGYLTREATVELAAGEVERIELALTPSALLLDPLLVTAEPSTRPAQCVPQLVSGRLVDDGTGAGIPDAHVHLLRADSSGISTARSDSEGRFALVTPGPGLYRLRGEGPDHLTAHGGELPILPGDTVEVEFRLSDGVALGEPMIVTGSARPWGDRTALVRSDDFFRRMTDCQTDPPVGTRFGQFLDRAAIEAWEGEERIIGRMIADEGREVFRYAWDQELELMGNCTPQLYVDGRWVPPAFDPMGYLYHFNTDMLEAVEIHRAPQIPQAFRSSQEAGGQLPCGVVALWTRRPEGMPDPPSTLRRALISFGVLAGLVLLVQ